MEISFICIYNNVKQLNDMLVPSLKLLGFGASIDGLVKGGEGYNALFINNIDNHYKSAAQAFNSEIKANFSQLGDILVFIHQDIAFDNIDFWNRLKSEFEVNKNQIIGAAGKCTKGYVLSNLKYQKTNDYIVTHQINEKCEVLSLDECCFAITKDLFKNLWFDGKTCFHWHLYAVDLCYEAKRKYNVNSYVIPYIIYHKTDDSIGLRADNYFIRTMWRLTRKYHKSFNRIYSTCYIVDTSIGLALPNLLHAYCYNLLRDIKKLLK